MGQWWALSGLGDLSLLAGVAAWGGDVWEGRGEVIYMFNLLHVDADIHVHVPSHVGWIPYASGHMLARTK